MAGVKIGRNEPCLCGSRKKYKHCCGSNKVVSMNVLVDQEMQELQSRLIEYAMDEYYEDIEEYLTDRLGELPITPEVEEEFFFRILMWVIFTVPIEDELTIVEEFVQKSQRQIRRPLLKESLLQWNEYSFTFATVDAIKKVDEMVVTDLFSNEVKSVKLLEAIDALEENSIVIGILVPYLDKFVFFNGFILISPSQVEAVKDDLFHLVNSSDVTRDEWLDLGFPELLSTAISGDIIGEIVSQLTWEEAVYQDVITKFEEGMEEEEYPIGVIQSGILMWHRYCHTALPTVRNPNLYAAILEYIVSDLVEDNGDGPSQKMLAEKYNVSKSSISAKYRDVIEVLEEEYDEYLPDME